MFKKTSLFRIIIVIAIVLSNNYQSTAQVMGFENAYEQSGGPLITEDVIIVMELAEPNSCVTYQGCTVQVNGFDITITVNFLYDPPPPACLFFYNQFTDLLNIGKLPAGVYTATVTGTNVTNTPFQFSFEVFPTGNCIEPDVINLGKACPGGTQVCGCNGVTYANACTAFYKNGVTSWTNGACVNSCVSNPVSVNITPSAPMPICFGNTVNLTATGSGSTSPYTYAWSNSAVGGTINVPATTATYTVTVTSSVGCTATASQVVTVLEPIGISNLNANGLSGSFVVSGGLPELNGSNYTSLTMTLQGNPGVTGTLTTAPFTHGETVSFSVPQAGKYIVSTSDQNGCGAQAILEIFSGAGTCSVTCPANQILPSICATQPLPDFSFGAGLVGCSDSLWQTPAPGTLLSAIVGSSPMAGQTFPISLSGREGGQISTCSFNVTLEDGTAPVPFFIPLPALTSDCAPDTIEAPRANRVCPDNQVAYGVPSSAFTLIAGTPPRYIVSTGNYFTTWSFNDGNGNITTQLQNIAVGNDNTPPVVICETAFSITLDANGEAVLTTNQVDAGSYDLANCGPLALGINPSMFTASDLGTNTVTLQATDQAGNTATCVTQVTVEAMDTLTFVVSDASVPQNTVFPIDVTTSGFTNLGGLQFTIQWDPAIIEYQFIDWMVPLMNQGFDTVTQISAGRFTFSWFQLSPLSIVDQTVLFRVYFRAIGNAGSSSMVEFGTTPTPLEAFDDQSNIQPVITFPGTVTILPNACTTVTTTADTGPGSLREAINCANTNPGPDTIRFNIPGAGPHVIALQTVLPIIEDHFTVIDGTTLPGWSLGSLVLDGINFQGQSDGLLTAGGVIGFELYGLVIKNATSGGLGLWACRDFKIGAPGKGNAFYDNNRIGPTYPGCTSDGSCESNVQFWYCHNGLIQSNRFGMTETGAAQQTLTPWGMTASGSNIQIGGSSSAGEGNIFVSCGWGMGLWTITDSVTTTNIRIYGNAIGTDFIGSSNLGNDQGINLGGLLNDIKVGGGTADLENQIWYNNFAFGGYGSEEKQVWLHRNSLACNGDAGILECTCDPQQAQNEVIINTAEAGQITGTGFPGSLVEVYRSDNTNCPNAPCQGTIWLGEATPDAAGNWTLNNPAVPLSAGNLITATGTLNGKTWAFADCVAVANSNSICDPVNDSLILRDFYTATNGSSWLTDDNWLVPGSPVSDWWGIFTTAEGCVYEINVDNNNLSGTLNANLGNIARLRRLIVYENNIGGPIPTSLGNARSMRELVLFQNQLTGPIPASLGNLDSMVFLWIYGNELTGGMPSFFSGMKSILEIEASRNNFDQEIADFAGSMPDLRRFLIDRNRLTFEDLLPGFNSIQQVISQNNTLPGYTIFQYAPQDSVFHDTTLILNPGANLDFTLDFDENVSGNVYRWFKDGAYQPSQDQTGNNNLVINNANASHAGVWQVQVTNPAAPDLTLFSRKITVQIGSCNVQTPPAITSPTALCSGAATLSVAGNFTQYAWSNSQSSATINVNQQGTYTVTVTDANGCTGTDSQVISGNVTNPVPAITGPTALCSGTATLSVSGNFTQYAWSNSQSSAAINVNQQGTYTVTVTDSNGCTGTDSQVISGNVPNPAPAIAGPTALCSGSATLSVAGNFTQYAWSNSQSSAAINVTQQGTYTVTVTDANGCSGTDSQVISGNVTNPVPAITGPTALCSGSATLSVAGNFTQYAWSNSQSSATINVNQQGTYTVTVTDANGCTGTDSQVISGNVPNPAPAITGPTALCSGAATLSVAGNFTQYAWSNSQSSAAINVTQQGSYTVTVTDANGCTGTDSQVINGSVTNPAPTITGPTALCASGVLLQVTGTYNQYNWSTGATTPEISVAQGGTYTVTVTDANGCTGTDTQVVSNNGVVLNPVITGPTALCSGTATLQTIGNFDQYNWSNSQNGSAITVTQQGTYTVTVTDANGCTASDTQTLSGNVPNPVPSFTSSTVLCGSSLTLQVAGSYAQYLWSGGQTSPTLLVNQPGNYSLTVTDANGCNGSAATSISGNALTISTSATQATSCTTPNGAVALTVNGAAGTPTFNWNNGASTQNIQNILPGAYTVTVTDANGCTAVSQSTVNGPMPMQLNVSVTAATSCTTANGALNLSVQSGTPPYAYLWSNSTTAEDLSQLAEGIYTVTVTDAGQCTASQTAAISNTNTSGVSSSQAQVICPGDSLLFNGVYYKNPGVYQQALSSWLGCDSVATLTLSWQNPGNYLAEADSFFVFNTLDAELLDVLFNDVLSNNQFTLEVLTQPQNGEVEVKDNEALLYRLRQEGFVGIEVIRYTLCSAVCTSQCDTAVALVIVTEDAEETLKKHLTNVLTPGIQDGLNDLFDPVAVLEELGHEVNELNSSLDIFNRWGDLIVSKENTNLNWDGMSNNSPVPQGTYYFVFRADVGQAKPAVVAGAISVLRGKGE